MSAPAVLFDELGPKARRRVWYASIATVLIAAFLLFLAYQQLDENDQFAGSLWEPFTQWVVWRGLLKGLWKTIQAAMVSMLLCIVIGALMALGRLTQNKPVRWLCGIYVEFFRAIPVLILMTFAFIGLPQFGVDLSSFWAIVLGLTLYNSAMLAEIFRAGILSLDRGQKEAATALGLGYAQSMQYVIVPQAGRRMIPSIISQLVALLKDTSLGAALTYVELLKTAGIYANYYGNLLQFYFVAAVIYMLVNLVLSKLAQRLEVRQRRRYKTTPALVAGAAENTNLTGLG
jgi:glutamate transport system permease protein